MKTNNATRKVSGWTRDGRLYKLTLECGHIAYKRGSSSDAPKTGKCPRWPDACDITARPIESVVSLGDLGPVLGDS